MPPVANAKMEVYESFAETGENMKVLLMAFDEQPGFGEARCSRYRNTRLTLQARKPFSFLRHRLDSGQAVVPSTVDAFAMVGGDVAHGTVSEGEFRDAAFLGDAVLQV